MVAGAYLTRCPKNRSERRSNFSNTRSKMSKARSRNGALSLGRPSASDHIPTAASSSSEPSLTKLPTLSSYLDAMQQLLAFILRIPPIDPSTSLRIAFLLRLTNDAMNSVPGYPPEMDDLQQLLDFLDDLDEAWLAVLNSQVWDPASGAVVDLMIPVGMIQPDRPIRSSPVSQTERTRLHSLFLTGTAALEEWLSTLHTHGEDYQLVLERAGLMEAFDNLFSKTLARMGGLSEESSDPVGMVGTC